jgi:hypothetical protein
MNRILQGRWTAQTEGDFVVFIIGMRINQWWMIHRWLPLIRAMGGMIRELSLRPELGFLGGKTWFGRTIVLIQYWRSFDDLETYAKAKDLSHLPAWADFNRRIGNDGTVGIYHETYRIGLGQYENVFVNMPPTLLGDCATLIEASGELASAAGRMERGGDCSVSQQVKPEQVAEHDEDRHAPPLDRTTAMDTQCLGATAGMQPRSPFEKRQPLDRGLPDQRREPTADLMALVEQALAMADAESLAHVGIDLCSALARLRDIADTAQREGQRDCG